MNKLFGIYETLHDAGVRMFDCEVGFAKAVTVALDRDFAVFIDPSQLSGSAEETCVVAHEAGHILTGATHRVDSPSISSSVTNGAQSAGRLSAFCRLTSCVTHCAAAFPSHGSWQSVLTCLRNL